MKLDVLRLPPKGVRRKCFHWLTILQGQQRFRFSVPHGVGDVKRRYREICLSTVGPSGRAGERWTGYMSGASQVVNACWTRPFLLQTPSVLALCFSSIMYSCTKCCNSSLGNLLSLLHLFEFILCSVKHHVAKCPSGYCKQTDFRSKGKSSTESQHKDSISIKIASA